MHTNFVLLLTTTPCLADVLAYQLSEFVRHSTLEGEHHVLTSPAGMQVEIHISQPLADWMVSLGSGLSLAGLTQG